MPEGEEERAPPWRGWHVIGRFLPMVVLGIIFLIIAVTNSAPHRGAEDFSPLFLWIGAVLLVAAVLGMLFTKCPICYRTHWVICFQEPDVTRRSRHQGYQRELSSREDES